MNNFKKALCLLLALVLLLCAAGCNSKKNSTGKKKKNSSKGAASEISSEVSSENSTAIDDEDWEDPVDDDDDREIEDPEEEEAFLEANLKLNNASTPLQSSFLGFNAVYHAYTFRSDKYHRQHSERTAQAELDAAKKSGIHIARTYFDSQMLWDAARKKLDYDSDSMQALYSWCGELKKRDIDVLVNYWYAFREIYGEYFGADHANKKNTYLTGLKPESIYVEGDVPKTIDNFANLMVELVRQLQARGYTNARYLSLSTEPGFTAYEYNGITDPAKLAEIYAKEYLAYANVVNAKLKTAGLRNAVTIMGPNEGATTTNGGYMMKAVYNLDKEGATDLYSSHSYCNNIDILNDNFDYWDEDIKLKLQNFGGGKDKFVFDEYNYGQGNALTWRRNNPYFGTQIALQQMAVLQNGLKSSFMWTLFDQKWPDSNSNNTSDSWENGVHCWGLLPNYIVDSQPHPGFYAFQLIANYLGQSGSKIYGCNYGSAAGQSIYCVMSETPDGSVGVALVNANADRAAVTVNFEKALGKTLYRHEFDPAVILKNESNNILPVSAKISNCKTGFEDILPAYGVTVYTTQK